MRRVLFAACLWLGCDAAGSQPPAAEPEATPEAVPKADVATVVEAPVAVRADPEMNAEPESPAEPEPQPFALVEVKPAAGPLKQQLRMHAKRAAARGQRVVLEMGAPWCPPCRRAKLLLAQSAVQAELTGLVLVRADSDVWGEELDAAGFNAPVIPMYYRLDADGAPTDVKVRGDRWKSHAQVRTGLLAFLRG